MTKKFLLIVLAATTAAPLDLEAQPYTSVVGDKTVTSIRRPKTRGLGISQEELLKAARDSVPIIIVPSDATRERKVK